MELPSCITLTGDKFKVQVTVDGRTHYVGTFDTEAQAVTALDAFVPVINLPTNISYSYVRRRYMAYTSGRHRKHYVGCYRTLEEAIIGRDKHQEIADQPDIWDISREQVHRLSQHPYAVKRKIV